jgi:hypothetical protein
LLSACNDEIAVGGIKGDANYAKGKPTEMPWAKPAAWEYAPPGIESSTGGSGGHGGRKKTGRTGGRVEGDAESRPRRGW